VEDLHFIVLLENITYPSNSSFWYWLKNRGQFPKIGLDGSIILDFFCVMARTRPDFSSNRFGLVEDL
jgi:hypothetical protein